MDYFQVDYFFLLIFYWCSLGGGTHSITRFIRQADHEARGVCSRGMFECSSGSCIKQANVCDGLDQCSDGTDESPTACDCGTRGLVETTRISGNAPGVNDAQAGAHPWHVGVYRSRNNNHYTLICIGALIYDDIVLTSANCVFDSETCLTLPTSAIHIGAGKLKRDYIVEEPFQQSFGLSEITILDRYEGDTKGYARNLAILKLKGKISRSKYIRPICLWKSRFFPQDAKQATITGWGLQFIGNYAVNLREARANLMDINVCIRTFYDALYKRFLTNDKFCLTFDQGVGLKEDDTGGPVTVFFDGRYYLLGVLSAKVFGTEFGIATKVSKHINWIHNTTFHLKETDRCKEGGHYMCSGTQCIKMDKVCDGNEDCPDGSDEDPTRCPKQPSPPKFDTNEKTCRIPDGIADIKVTRCGDSSGCWSKYNAPSNSIYNVTCPHGYGFSQPNITSVSMVCLEGAWYPPYRENPCLTLCEGMEYKSLQLTCQYLGNEVPCNESLRPGTRIKIQCKRQFKVQPLINFAQQTTCRKDGTILHELTECVPVCGVPFDPKGEVLISNGKEVDFAKYPWHIALYWKKIKETQETDFEFKCGGTLIDTNKVLTAAHCVWVSNSKVFPEKLAVAVGKLHSNWWIKDDWEQKVGVTQVIYGKHYNGAKNKHSQDIAVLILAESLKLSAYTMPACLNLDSNGGGIPKNELGHVLGWGRLSEQSDHPSEKLMETWMQYLDLDTCRTRFESYGFNDYLQPDKFCVLYNNGSGTQSGDSGGGITFIQDGLHYVYGVVSIKRTGQNNFAAFTNVLSHSAWLKDILKHY